MRAPPHSHVKEDAPTPSVLRPIPRKLESGQGVAFFHQYNDSSNITPIDIEGRNGVVAHFRVSQ